VISAKILGLIFLRYIAGIKGVDNKKAEPNDPAFILLIAG